MNNYDSKAYENTFKDARFWDGLRTESPLDNRKLWMECRCLTDTFYDELVIRGYLIPFPKSSDRPFL